MNDLQAGLATRFVPPGLVREALRAHDRRQSSRATPFRSFRALWRTQYWQDRRGDKADRYNDKSEDPMIRVETNAIHGFVTSFLGSLFTDDVRVEYEPDAYGRGDQVLAAMVVNRLLHARLTALRLLDALRQAIIYDYAGLKVGLDADGTTPEAKVWIRVVPGQELVLDRDVRDRADQRFVGHVYDIPLAEAMRRFGTAKLKTHKRADTLASDGELRLGGSSAPSPEMTPLGDALNEEFVRVLDWYNLKDRYCAGEADPLTGIPYPEWVPVVDEHGHKVEARGRFEVYLPDEPEGFERPYRVFPMPFADLDGGPLPSVLPLVLHYDPEYPLHGLSTVERVYDQFREKILSRTYEANGVKKNARVAVAPKGLFSADEKEKWAQGVDGEWIEYEDKEGKYTNAQAVVGTIQLQPFNPDNSRYDDKVDEDIVRGTSQPPFTHGDPTGASATEVNQLAAHAKTGIGIMAMLRDLLLEDLQRLLLRALVRAQRACGPDAAIRVTIHDRVLPVTVDDIDADFPCTVKSPPFTEIEADRDRQTFLTVMGFGAPFIEQVRQGDDVAAMIWDHAVDLYKLPRDFGSDNIRRLHAASASRQPPAPPPPNPDAPRLPGAASSLPGAGSTPSLPDAGATTPGGPQPGGPAPMDVTAGTLQNGPGAANQPEA